MSSFDTSIAMLPAAARRRKPEESSLLPDLRLAYQKGQAIGFDEAPSERIGSTQSLGHAQYASKTEAYDAVEHSQWRTGFWLRFPIWGILALAATILATLAAVLVTVKCDNQSVSSWKVSPTVILSIVASLSNILLTFALGEGLVVSFWWHSVQGSSIRGLHDNWYAGSSFLGAIKTIVHGRASFFNSLACILTLVSVLRGPLLQRAISPVSGILVTHTGNMTLNFAQNVPATYGAGVASTGDSTPGTGGALSWQAPNLRDVILQYTSGTNMTMEHPECGESCSTTVNGFGLGVNCTTQTRNVTEAGFDCTDPALGQATCSVDINSIYFQVLTQLNELDFGSDYNSSLTLDTTYLPENYTQTTVQSTPGQYGQYDSNVTKNLVGRECVLTSGIVAYDIILQNGTVTLKHDDYTSDVFLYPIANNRVEINSTLLTLMGGLALAADYLFSSNATFSASPGGTNYALNGPLANQFMAGNISDLIFYNAYWTDPTDYMLNQLRQISFRMALQAGQDNETNSNATQTSVYTGTSTQTVFSTNYALVAVAAALNILAVLAILPTYYGWWALGRECSLSPLEIARAFRAPLLNSEGLGGSWKQIYQDVGERNVRYKMADFQNIAYTTGTDTQLAFVEE